MTACVWTHSEIKTNQKDKLRKKIKVRKEDKLKWSGDEKLERKNEKTRKARRTIWSKFVGRKLFLGNILHTHLHVGGSIRRAWRNKSEDV